MSAVSQKRAQKRNLLLSHDGADGKMQLKLESEGAPMMQLKQMVDKAAALSEQDTVLQMLRVCNNWTSFLSCHVSRTIGRRSCCQRASAQSFKKRAVLAPDISFQALW